MARAINKGKVDKETLLTAWRLMCQARAMPAIYDENRTITKTHLRSS